MKKFGLGKGLSALIPDEEYKVGDIAFIDIEKIKPSRLQPRINFKDEELQELAQSIKEKGVLQPILVRKVEGDEYELISGERRYRASKIAGILQIPAIIKECNEEESLQISLIENLQRENLNPVEEARGYKELIEKFNFTQETISKKIGKSRPYIANILRLLNLPDFILQGIIEEKITEGHGRCLLSLPSQELQSKVYYQIILEKLSVRQTEDLVKSIISPDRKPKRKKSTTHIYISDLVEKLSSFLGTKVRITGGGKKGKLYIDYYSREDLERLIDIILK